VDRTVPNGPSYKWDLATRIAKATVQIVDGSAAGHDSDYITQGRKAL
jgi:hypothetical protein